MRWSNITVRQYQELERINESNFDDFDKLAYSICCIWNLKQEDVNQWSEKKFIRYCDKVTKLMKSEPRRSLFYKRMNTDATKITFGQFIEMMFWLKSGSTYNLHMIGATISHGNDHSDDANKFLDYSITKVLYPIGEFLNSWKRLIDSYSGLFEIDPDEDPKEGVANMSDKSNIHPFIDRYGWIFAAASVAEHERVSLDKAFEIPVVQALNDLSYLKSKNKFDKWQVKQ
jgi:hypothetical protein